jgi:hypothetical protein
VRSPAFLLLGLVVAGVTTADASPPETKRVAGKAVLVSTVCGGGAAIRREQWEQLPPPQPLGGKAFLVVRGDRITAAPPSARFVTRPDGTFTIRLPPGTWCFFDASRKPTPDRPGPIAAPSPNVDGDCLTAQKQRCDLVLPVKSDVNRAEISFTARCPQPWNQPCYHGPMPP